MRLLRQSQRPLLLILRQLHAILLKQLMNFAVPFCHASREFSNLSLQNIHLVLGLLMHRLFPSQHHFQCLVGVKVNAHQISFLCYFDDQ